MPKMHNQDFRVVAAETKKGRNKQGSHSQPRRAWKELSELLYRESGGVIPTDPPAPRRRPRRKTIKLYKDEAAVERGRRGAATRKANAPQRAAQSEHERRSKAAKKGWDKIPASERTARAKRGWDTRDARYGHPRGSEQIKRDRRAAKETEQRRRTPNYAERFPRPRYDF